MDRSLIQIVKGCRRARSDSDRPRDEPRVSARGARRHRAARRRSAGGSSAGRGRARVVVAGDAVDDGIERTDRRRRVRTDVPDCVLRRRAADDLHAGFVDAGRYDLRGASEVREHDDAPRAPIRRPPSVRTVRVHVRRGVDQARAPVARERLLFHRHQPRRALSYVLFARNAAGVVFVHARRGRISGFDRGFDERLEAMTSAAFWKSTTISNRFCSKTAYGAGATRKAPRSSAHRMFAGLVERVIEIPKARSPTIRDGGVVFLAARAVA